MKTTIAILLTLATAVTAAGQAVERERPAEWSRLVEGGRFMDRFEAMEGNRLERGPWGAECVRQRLTDNGIEDTERSYWGGNIVKGDDGKYHLFVAAWPENSPKGHGTWPKSDVMHAVSESMHGPFTVADSVGKGHNPEVYRLPDGRYVLYVIKGRYVGESLYGPWEYGEFEFDAQGKKVSDGYSNMSFARRPEGGYLMVSRGGEIWENENGLDTWKMVEESVYPKVEGRFEDPVVWRDSVQYHLIVNDWLGRIAYYMRSPDGRRWVTDAGEAYTPGIARHKDGTSEDWFKYERMRICQDEHGRAVQANFAVIDTLKKEDRANDTHSSKNICIALNPGMLLSMSTDAGKDEVKVTIRGEKGFNPAKDVDVQSLRFGNAADVDFGSGAKAVRTEKTGKDLTVVFRGADCALGDDEFAPKMLGRSNGGKLLFGYAKRF